MFIGRTQELQFLNEHYHSTKAEFISCMAGAASERPSF